MGVDRMTDEKLQTVRILNLIAQAGICVFTTDRKGVISQINRAGEKMFGYRADELVGQEISILFSGLNPPGLLETIEEKRLKGETWEVELWRRRKDGREILAWTLTSYVFDDDGRLQGSIVITRDVTRTKKDEERLRILKDLIDTASICMMTTDREGKVTSINRGGEKLYGYRAEEIIGRNVQIIFSDRNPKNLLDKIDEKRLNGENWEASLWRKRKDGNEILTWLATSYLFDKDGKMRGTLGIARDITVERSIQDHYRMLGKLIDTASICIMSIDREGRIISINRAGEELYGYRADELVGQEINRLFSDRNSPEQMQRIEKMRLRSESWDAELWRRRKDGREILTWLSTSYLVNEEDKLEGAIGIARDITEEKNNQERLKFMASLVDNVSHCVISTDSRGNIRTINAAGLKMFGYAEEEIVGCPVSDLYPEAVSPDKIREIYETAMRRDVWEGEMPGKKKDGSIFPLWLSTSYIFDRKGKAEGAVGISRDITREKETYRKLELLGKLIEDASHCIILTDGEGRIASINKAGEKMYGYDEGELINRHLNILYSDKNPPALLKSIEDQARSKSAWEAELWRKKKSGEEFPTWISTSYLFDEIGRFNGSLGISRDISERKVFEEQLFHSTRMATLGEIAAGVAHEVRNPLTGIKLGLNTLAENLSAEREELGIIQDLFGEMERLEKVVNQLLGFARKRAVRKEAKDIKDILDWSLFYIQKSLKQKKIKVEKHYADLLPRVNVDGDQMLQVFLNLALNAVQAMKDGGRLELTTRFFQDRSKYSVGRDSILVEIVDDGQGIPPEQLASIFSPFFSTREEGTGLGLAMAKRIIEAHEGTIEIASQVGRGTRVSILLPCQ